MVPLDGGGAARDVVEVAVRELVADTLVGPGGRMRRGGGIDGGRSLNRVFLGYSHFSLRFRKKPTVSRSISAPRVVVR
jgi:hypothetical protein